MVPTGGAEGKGGGGGREAMQANGQVRWSTDIPFED